MNDYMQVRFDVEPCSEMATDVLAAVLAEIGYESFVPDERGVTAFVPQGKYDETRLKEELSQYPIGGVSVTYEATFVVGRDWNEEWEKNYFKPIVVGDECVIHSTFHTDIPQARYDVLIDPKNGFWDGTSRNYHSHVAGYIGIGSYRSLGARYGVWYGCIGYFGSYEGGGFRCRCRH